MHLSRNLARKIASLPTVQRGTNEVVEDFAILIEMHQDKDGYIDQFRHAFIRGECAPMKVHLDFPAQLLMNDVGDVCGLDPNRQKFMTIEAWSKFVMEFIMTEGNSPVANGVMPTRLLRDARKGYNHLRSFRQMVEAQYLAHARAGTLVKP